MIDLVRRFFEKVTSSGPEGRESDPRHDVRVAACALLLEMAQIDGQFDDAEKERILGILKRGYQLSPEGADSLLQASRQELEGSVDLWQFTRLINQNYSSEEKIAILETVWEIAFTDGRLEKHEDYLAHKMANLLHLDHEQLIGAKLRAREKVASRSANPPQASDR
jgi:uncharacterized tellurite resistance protein B-like protein